jgi:alpha-1,3-glucosyltransferase
LVAFTSSRGHESVAGKVFMRASVLLCDACIYIPAVLIGVRTAAKKAAAGADASLLWAMCALASPATLLIDHGHFQYNGVCLGLALLAACAVLADRDVVGSVLFCLSLNFKQMALYYAPVFFFALLRKCLDKAWGRGGWPAGLTHLAKIGATVIATFAALWWPFCAYPSDGETCVSSLLHVLSRQFPFARGIFEDKVANWWYTLSVAVDMRRLLAVAQLAQLSLATTLALLAPVATDLLRRPATPRRLFFALVNCAMAFFLASFQVHEKSLLLAMVPALLLLDDEPLLVGWFQLFGAHTMFPLLVRDGLRVPYFATCALFVAVCGLRALRRDGKDVSGERPPTDAPPAPPPRDGVEVSLRPLGVVTAAAAKGRTFYIPRGKPSAADGARALAARWHRARVAFVTLSGAGAAVLHVLEAAVPPPPRYPDLYPALFSLFGAMNLTVVYVAGVAIQWRDR